MFTLVLIYLDVTGRFLFVTGFRRRCSPRTPFLSGLRLLHHFAKLPRLCTSSFSYQHAQRNTTAKPAIAAAARLLLLLPASLRAEDRAPARLLLAKLMPRPGELRWLEQGWGGGFFRQAGRQQIQGPQLRWWCRVWEVKNFIVAPVLFGPRQGQTMRIDTYPADPHASVCASGCASREIVFVCIGCL